MLFILRERNTPLLARKKKITPLLFYLLIFAHFFQPV